MNNPLSSQVITEAERKKDNNRLRKGKAHLYGIKNLNFIKEERFNWRNPPKDWERRQSTKQNKRTWEGHGCAMHDIKVYKNKKVIWTSK